MKCSLIILMMYQKTRAQDDPSAANSDSLFDSPMEMRMSLQLPFHLPSPAWCTSLEDPAPRAGGGGGLGGGGPGGGRPAGAAVPRGDVRPQGWHTRVSARVPCAGGGPDVSTSLVRHRDPEEAAHWVEVVKPLGDSKSGGACFVWNSTPPHCAFSHQGSSGLMERSR